jgi:hypothetical protein
VETEHTETLAIGGNYNEETLNLTRCLAVWQEHAVRNLRGRTMLSRECLNAQPRPRLGGRLDVKRRKLK